MEAGGEELGSNSLRSRGPSCPFVRFGGCEPYSLEWITGLAAALMALVTAWAPAKKMKAYNLALNSIESACRRYEYEDPGNDLKHLNDAVDEGEKIIATE